MLPRVVVRVRRAVRRFVGHPEMNEPSGPEIEARWQAMLFEVGRRDREAERRLRAAERGLNGRARS